jgi:4-amino-4-deoxy-L-arabinose transferase-like glycosyltransferase
VTTRHLHVLALVWVGLAGLAVAIAGGALGNDEAQYALGARSLVDDAPDRFPLFRSIGMRVVAAPGVLAGGGELAIRLPFVLIAVAYATLVWRIARRLGGEPAATVALAVQVTAAPWLTRTGEALSDIPAACLVLAMVALVQDDVARPEARARAWVAVALAGAAAFYVRYGSAPVIAVTMLAVIAWFPSRRRAAVAAAAGIALAVVPFLWWSAARTGSVLGVVRISEDAANRAYVGDGLWWYLTRWPMAVAGPVMGAVALVGLAVVWRRRERVSMVLVAAAIAQIVVLGLRAHGEARYVFFATSALTIVGAAWIAARPRWRAVTLASCAVSAVLGGGYAVARVDAMAQRRAALVSAASAVRADARGARCLVYTGTRPQVAWYTRCHTFLIGPEPAYVAAARGFARVYLLSAEGAPRQPESGAASSAPTLEFRPLASGHDPDWFVWRAR